MPVFTFAFLVHDARELDPPLLVAGRSLQPFQLDTEMQALMGDRLPRLHRDAVSETGAVLTVVVQMEAPDEKEAIALAYREAVIAIQPYSLLEKEKEQIDFSRSRPSVLPTAILLSTERGELAGDVRFYDGPLLARFFVSPETMNTVKQYNNGVVRRLAELYPQSLTTGGAAPSALELRVARAVHWFSQGEGLADESLAFVCYWIGLEALVLKSSNTKNKEGKIATRLANLARHHDSSSDRIDWSGETLRLWATRADIIHEGAGRKLEALIPSVGAQQINSVKYLFLLALLYVLEQIAQGASAEMLWDPRRLDPYQPGVAVLFDDLPQLHRILNQRRSWEVAS
jgi:hypothetical protein